MVGDPEWKDDLAGVQVAGRSTVVLIVEDIDETVGDLAGRVGRGKFFPENDGIARGVARGGPPMVRFPPSSTLEGIP